MKHEIQKFLEKAIKTLGYDIKEVDVDYPKNEVFGDYTTNVAMVLSKSVKKNPMTVAEEIVAVIASEVKQSQNSKIKLKKNEIATSPSAPRNDENIFEKIEIAKPGYINFYLSKEYLQNNS